MFATLFNVEFTNVYIIFSFHSFLNLFLRNVLILRNILIYSHIILIFVERVFYVGQIWLAILEKVDCVCPMRFCRFFRALFAYKWHAWAFISYHVIQRDFTVTSVISTYPGYTVRTSVLVTRRASLSMLFACYIFWAHLEPFRSRWAR